MEQPKKAGRPTVVLDKEEVYKLALFHCTLKEMGDFFKVHPDTLRDNYSTEIEKGRSEGKIRLRKKQFDVALKGNVSMLIWLGKQMLGQNDLNNSDDNTPLPITDFV